MKNVPESNGRVGTIGGSYEGYTTVMSTVNPHPALKAAVPFAPMIDGWMGDDWFHNGAFRQGGTLEFIYGQQAARKGDHKWWSRRVRHLRHVPARRLGRRARDVARPRSTRFLARARRAPELRRVVAASGGRQAAREGAGDRADDDRRRTVRSGRHLRRPGAVSARSRRRIRSGEFVHLVLGPWNHGQGRREGRGIGAIQFEGDTAGWFRRTVMQPFLDHYLKDAPKPDTPRVLVYETGANEWQRVRSLAARLPRRMRRGVPLSVSAAGRPARLRSAGAPAMTLRRIRVRSRQARAVS